MSLTRFRPLLLVMGFSALTACMTPLHAAEAAEPSSAEAAEQAEPVDQVEADRLAGEAALKRGEAEAVPAAAEDGEADAADADDGSAAKAERSALSKVTGGLLGEDAGFRVVVKGLQGALLENVNAHLLGVPKDITVRGRYRTRVRQAVREAIRALGYYNGKIKLSWETGADGKRTNTLVAEVTPGDPVRLEAVDVSIEGEARDDRFFKWILRRAPKPGSRLDHGEYDKFKQQLQAAALQRGYFDAVFKKSELAVAPDLNQGFWRIDYDTGIRYRYGEVDFQGSQIEETYLRNLMPFEPGEHYDAEKVAELNRRLSATGWFSSVMVAPDWEAAKASDDPYALPMTGVVSPATRNSVEVGLGFATDVGPRMQTSWTKPWINERGHSLKGTLNLSAYEQIVDGTYKIPEEADPLGEYWQLQAGLKRTNLNDTESNSITLMAARYWELESGWQRSVGLKWSYDDFTQGTDTHKTMLVYPGVSFSRTRTRGGMMPFWGDSQRYTLDVSNTNLQSDVNFIAFNAQGVLIRSYAWRHRFVMRGNFGWIETDDFERVPPDLRFFAGGDRSVRGYDYKSISPKDENGDLTGASRLLTASLEYQYNVTGKWWGAVFTDVGEAVNDLKDLELKKGVGVGVRWSSPVGPVKFDLAMPVGDPDHKGLAFYIGLGSEL